MARMNGVVTVGRGEFTASCPVPPDRIRLVEGLRLMLRGWLDAATYRTVVDTEHTHTLLALQSLHRRREVEVVRSVDAAISLVDVAQAEVDAVLAGAQPPELEVPTSDELRSLEAANDRAAWAARVRAARAANAHARATGDRREAAARRSAELGAVRRALIVEGGDVQRKWKEAYEVRAARYTRARFGRRGAKVSPSPRVAAYDPDLGPTEMRRP